MERLAKRHLNLMVLVLVVLFAISPAPVWAQAEEDLSDTLLLYDSRNETASDVNFRKISEYYGLKWAAVDLLTTILTTAHLKDGGGEYYRAIGISESALALLNSSDVKQAEADGPARPGGRARLMEGEGG